MTRRTCATRAKVAKEIAAFGAQPGVDETRLLKLRNRGADAYSGLPLPELVDRVGEAASAPVLAALAEPADQRAALRWVLRGLPVDLAIRKRQLQREAHPGRGHGLRRARAALAIAPEPGPVPAPWRLAADAPRAADRSHLPLTAPTVGS